MDGFFGAAAAAAAAATAFRARARAAFFIFMVTLKWVTQTVHRFYLGEMMPLWSKIFESSRLHCATDKSQRKKQDIKFLHNTKQPFVVAMHRMSPTLTKRHDASDIDRVDKIKL